jgi:hypothetical protein
MNLNDQQRGAQIAALATDLGLTKAQLTSLITNVTLLSNSVAAQGVQIGQILNSFSNYYTMSEVSAIVAQITTKADEQGLAITAIQSQLTNVYTKDQVTTLINGLQTTVTGQANLLSNMDLSIQQQGALITSLQSTTANQAALIANLQSTVEGQSALLASANANYATVQAILANLSISPEKYVNITNDVKALQDVDKERQKDIDTINQKIIDLESKQQPAGILGTNSNIIIYALIGLVAVLLLYNGKKRK